MLGVGPEWVHLKQAGKVTNFISGEVAADFMFWPTGKHRFGGFWNQPTITASLAAISNLLECLLVCSSALEQGISGNDVPRTEGPDLQLSPVCK
jgi:hypothetical protein